MNTIDLDYEHKHIVSHTASVKFVE